MNLFPLTSSIIKTLFCTLFMRKLVTVCNYYIVGVASLTTLQANGQQRKQKIVISCQFFCVKNMIEIKIMIDWKCK